MNRLNGKRTLITGGTSGMGLEAARQFLSEGARVAITGSNPATLAAAQAELGGEVVAIRADAGSVAEQDIVADAVRDAFGGLDAVFVNAGIGEFRPLGQWDETAFDRSMAVNLKGPFFLLQALLPLLANPASIVLNHLDQCAYRHAEFEYLRGDQGWAALARPNAVRRTDFRGIRVNAVSPGPIATPLHGKLGMNEDDVAALVKQIPAGHGACPTRSFRPLCSWPPTRAPSRSAASSSSTAA
jgi:NAD(P)-dependent dehydrogenase (short-subunit alcohol dehydrogenase family)